MIRSNTIDVFYEKQQKLALTGLELSHAVEKLLADINFLYPDLYKTNTVSKVNNLCTKMTKQIFSKDGSHE